jgi:hypothetical protein
MQFIFLYYDQNRNGRLEVEEVATMIEHIQQLHGESYSSAMVKSSWATDRIIVASGCVGWMEYDGMV